MPDHKPLPVHGYITQSKAAIDLVNEGKLLEEHLLRYFDKLDDYDALSSSPVPELITDKEMVALARTHLQIACMWAVRSVFQPQRVKLPEDDS